MASNECALGDCVRQEGPAITSPSPRQARSGRIRRNFCQLDESLRSILRVSLALLLLLLMAPLARAGDGLALTPPMGWNSWNKFACNVSEKLILERPTRWWRAE